MVEVLQRLEDEEIARLPYGNTSIEQQVHYTLTHPQGYALWESILIKEMLKFQCKSETDVVAMSINQKLLNSCIKAGFILEGTNESFTNIFPLPTGANPNANSSPRRVQVSGDKGVEILNWWYFWFKYIAEELPPLATMGISIITAILTSGAIWFFLLKVFGVKISIP